MTHVNYLFKEDVPIEIYRGLGISIDPGSLL
jgi:hypothetical protein